MAPPPQAQPQQSLNYYSSISPLRLWQSVLVISLSIGFTAFLLTKFAKVTLTHFLNAQLGECISGCGAILSPAQTITKSQKKPDC